MIVKNYQVVFILIVVCAILIFITFPYILPEVINPVDKSCEADYDCVLKDTDCDKCDCLGEAANRNWNKFCPLGEIGPTCYCYPMPSYLDFKAVCNKGTCERIKTPNCLGICEASKEYLESVNWQEVFNKNLEEIFKECNCSVSVTREESWKMNFSESKMFVLGFHGGIHPEFLENNMSCDEAGYYESLKICENNSYYSVSSVNVPYALDQNTKLWKGYEQFPNKDKKAGFTCAIFPSRLMDEINGPYTLFQLYIAHATNSPPTNLSCDIIHPNFYCAKFYYFDKIKPIITGGHTYSKDEIMQMLGPDLEELACGFYDTNAIKSTVKFLKSEGCTKQTKLYEEGKVGYIAFNLVSGEHPFGNYSLCVPKVKLTTKKNISILVVFAYSNQSIPDDAITTLKGSSKDKSINYIADWYRSEAFRLINKPINITFTFLDKQYEVYIDINRVMKEYEIRNEIVAEEKFLYKELIQPLKQQGVSFNNYDAILVLYNNPDLFSNKIWVSGGHADRHRGYAYVNLGIWLSNSKLDQGEAESIVSTSAHELGHVFGAWDIGTIEGKNCLIGSGTVSLSENELCTYKDVGWYDADGDGVIEVDDVCPYDEMNLCSGDNE